MRGDGRSGGRDETPGVVVPSTGAWRVPRNGAYANMLRHHDAHARERKSNVAALRQRVGVLNTREARAHDRMRPASSPSRARRRAPQEIAPLPRGPVGGALLALHHTALSEYRRCRLRYVPAMG